MSSNDQLSSSFCMIAMSITTVSAPIPCRGFNTTVNMFKNDRPSSAVDVYCRLSEIPSAFSDFLACYQLALTLPVASASAERSFSPMRRIKTRLRSSMADGRLSNLAIVTVERELSEALMENPDKVLLTNLLDRHIATRPYHTDYSQ